jgi:hypothetical protein
MATARSNAKLRVRVSVRDRLRVTIRLRWRNRVSLWSVLKFSQG